MSFITILIVLIIIGFILWIVNTFIPMAAPIKLILNAVVTLAVLIWVLSALGIINVSALKLK